jgi:iron complex transport system substrate-binding protein
MTVPSGAFVPLGRTSWIKRPSMTISTGPWLGVASSSSKAIAPVSVFLQINDVPLYTVNGRQIMSEIVDLCGGRNVFAALNDLAPQVGIEAVIAADPDVIISTGPADSPGFVQWQRWHAMRAVRAGNLFVLPPDDVARSTTRLVNGSQQMCRTLQTARDRLPHSN